jgi:endonuclease/exonuclease/phosphatase family metal-dependent hydrolase
MIRGILQFGILAAALSACSPAYIKYLPPVAPQTGVGELRLMTFNVMCSGCEGDWYPDFDQRVDYIADVIERWAPDFIGVQELLRKSEAEEILSEIGTGDYRFVGWGRFFDTTVFYDSNRWRIRDHGGVWLPKAQIFSLCRLMQWVHFEEVGSDSELILVNTHFDANPGNPEVSATKLVQEIGPWLSHLPLAALGDFNAPPYEDAYATLIGSSAYGLPLADTLQLNGGAWRIEPVTSGGFNAHDACHNHVGVPFPDCRIDHMFVSGIGSWQVEDWALDLTTYPIGASAGERRFPSDHRAVIVDLRHSVN